MRFLVQLLQLRCDHKYPAFAVSNECKNNITEYNDATLVVESAHDYVYVISQKTMCALVSPSLMNEPGEYTRNNIVFLQHNNCVLYEN